MLIAIYSPGQSYLHSLKAGIKLLALVVLATGLFILSNLLFSIIALVSAVGIYISCGLPRRYFIQLIKRSLWLLLMLLVLHLYLNDLIIALMVCLRLFALLIFATLLTLTTRMSEMIDTLEKVLSPLKMFGVNPAKVSFSLSLAIRFIPLLFEITAQVREAQSVRGADKNIIALFIPILVQTFKSADELTQAIEARGYDSETSDIETTKHKQG